MRNLNIIYHLLFCLYRLVLTQEITRWKVAEKTNTKGNSNEHIRNLSIRKNKEPPGWKTFFDWEIAFPIAQSWFVSCLLYTTFICPYNKLFTSFSARNVPQCDKFLEFVEWLDNGSRIGSQRFSEPNSTPQIGFHYWAWCQEIWPM